MAYYKFYEIGFLTAMENLSYDIPVYVLNPLTNEIERFYQDDMLVKYQAFSVHHLMNLQYFKRSGVIDNKVNVNIGTVISTRASRIVEVDINPNEINISPTIMQLVS